MNKQKEFLPFKEISDKYLSLKKSISNEDLQNLYMKFNFWKLDQIDDAKSEDCLNNFLKENMFFVYTKIPVIPNQELDFVDSILCFENHCLFTESSKLDSFKQAIRNSNIHFIDLNSTNRFVEEVKNEVSSFCSYYSIEMKSNEFVK
ncbi:hypothetical protein M9Y10_045168 [Tritrichomonas musculus]|uniref:Uncharacterized protein n=1 Tax=Tritrichomonas musculus TaxID=1915356 RepID=A0ABR2JUU4_9EUKA